MVCVNSTAADTSDGELIAETLRGHREAFGVLVRRYQDRLYNAMVHTVGNAEDARDVVQDTLLQAFRRLETFRSSSAFYTWLYRIALNTAASRRRRKQVPVSVDHARETRGDEPVDAGPAPGERLEREERCRRVRQAIALLPEEQRAVLVLRDLDGLHYEEIAVILDLPVGTVRSRLHRARLQFRDVLKRATFHGPGAAVA